MPKARWSNLGNSFKKRPDNKTVLFFSGVVVEKHDFSQHTPEGWKNTSIPQPKTSFLCPKPAGQNTKLLARNAHSNISPIQHHGSVSSSGLTRRESGLTRMRLDKRCPDASRQKVPGCVSTKGARTILCLLEQFCAQSPLGQRALGTKKFLRGFPENIGPELFAGKFLEESALIFQSFRF